MMAPAAPYHDPVMMEEVLRELQLRPGMTTVDGTLGLGGHTREILRRTVPGNLHIAFDWDAGMIDLARKDLPEGVEFVHADYRRIPEMLPMICARHGRQAFADAILMDLGLNSFQIEDSSRGISFLQEGPLDMRMDRTNGEPASSWLGRASEDEIEKVLRVYGGERWSRRIAKLVLERRKEKALRTTQDLVDCVHAAIPVNMRDKRIHAATRTFQAVRIHVNQELQDLETALIHIAKCLAPGGSLVVLSYHSGEDAPVKSAFRRLATTGFIDVLKKPAVPTAEEIQRNRRSRSAKLRVLRKPL